MTKDRTEEILADTEDSGWEDSYTCENLSPAGQDAFDAAQANPEHNVTVRGTANNPPDCMSTVTRAPP